MSVPQIYQQAPGNFQDKIRYTDSIISKFPDIAQTKGSGYKQYMREKSFWEPRLAGYSDPEQGRKNFNKALFKHALDHEGRANSYKTSTTYPAWNLVSDFNGMGPTTVNGTSYVSSIGRGLVNDIEVNPTDTNSWTIAIAGGGVWQTSDKGISWYDLDPNHYLPIQDAWDVEINPSNPDEIYVALTGFAASIIEISTYSLGVYKTTDNGQFWFYCDTIGILSSELLRESWAVRRVKVDRLNNDKVYAYGSLKVSGVVKDQFWYSESKGDTFTRVDIFPYIHSAYQNRMIKSSEEIYEDIHIAQTGSHNFVYLSGQNLLRSSDEGQTWTDITPNLAYLNDNTAACFGYYPMEMRLASNDSILYVIYNVQNIPVDSVTPSGDTIYKFIGLREEIYLEYSTDWGGTWNGINKIHSSKVSSFGNGGIGGGEFCIEIAPGDESSVYSNNRLVIGYVDYALSMDGGNNFNRITKAYASGNQNYPYHKWIHPDNRGLRLLPGSGGNIGILSANDGGVAYSSDSGNTWNIRNEGLHSEPLAGIALWEENSDTLMAGAIHIGGILKLGKKCYTTSQGDYGDVLLSKTDSFVSFVGTQLPFNRIEHNSDFIFGGILFNGIAKFKTINYPRLTIAVHPLTPSVVLGCKRKYSNPDTSFLMLSFNHGGLFDTTANAFLSDHKNYTDISICKSSPNVMYAIAGENILYGTAQPYSKIIWRSNNSGISWQDITDTTTNNGVLKGHLQWFNNAIGIVVDPDDPNKVFIYYSSFGNQENAARVVMSTDGGSTFSDISQGLPAFPVTDLVCVPGEEDELFLANDVNVYYTNKNLNNVWSLYDNGLPTGMMRDLEYHYKDRKLFVATTGRGIWETELPCDSISNTPTTISGNVLWDIDRSPLGDIIIPANCTLTIKNCQIRMRDNRFIAVERGGLLILEDATLTSCSNTTQWSGIMVWGNSSIQAQSYAPYGNFGKVVMNQSMIENAKNGVILCKLDYSTLAIDYSTCGGIIEANYTIFKNCRKSIAFMKHPAPNYNATLLRCDFINTRPNSSAAPVFVSLWGVKNVLFQGCTFTNIDTAEFYKMRGVYSIDATYKFINYGTFNSFTNLAYGIQVENSISTHHIEVDKCKFINCARGVFWSNANFSRVTNSNFEIRNYNPFIPYGWCLIPNQFGDTYGIYSDFSNAFTIEENTFSSYGGLSVYNTALGYDRQNGCVIRNNYGYADELYRNVFKELLLAVKSVGINREMTSTTFPNPMLEYILQDKGLEILCNTFDYLIPYTDIGIIGLVAKDQGINTPFNKVGAGNMFKANGNGSSSGGLGKNICYIPDYPGLDTIMGYHLTILNNSLNHLYYVHDNGNVMIPSELQFANLDTIFADHTTATNRQFDPTSSCLNRLNNNGSGPPFPWDAISVYNDSISVGTTLVSSGDSDDLIDAIDNESIEDAKDLLDAASPYLSDRILIHIIDQAYIEYASEWKDVLVRNSPLASHIYPLTFEVEMPTEARDELAEAQMEYFSPRDYLKAKVTHYKDSVDLHLKKSSEYIFPRMGISTTSRDSLLLLYEKDRSVHAILKRIDFCLYTDEYAQYEQLIDTLEAADSVIYYDLAEILRDLSSVYNSPEGISSIDPTMKTTLEDYVEDRKPFYERFENILISTGNRIRCYPDITIKYGVGGSAFKHTFPDASLRITYEEGWNVFPNPSDGIVSEYLKTNKELLYDYTIFDISGRVMSEVKDQKSNKKYFIPTNALQSGLYFLQAKTASGKQFTQKLLIR